MADTTTGKSAQSTPTTNRLRFEPLPTTVAALRAILAEVTPGTRPYSTDSYLPDYLVKQAQQALDGVTQDEAAIALHLQAHNALSVAGWHIARGDVPAALSRIRRAQTHIAHSMEGRA